MNLVGKDSLGNRTDQPVNSAINRATGGASWDDGGNMTGNGVMSFTWDGLNTMVTVVDLNKNQRYLYTADDERIGSFDANLSKWSWRICGLGNEVLRELTSTGGTYSTTTWTWQKDYIYRAGGLLASVTPSGTRYFHLDHLGTPRLITDAAKSGEAHSYYPFGLEATFVQYDPEPMKFTGHERDFASTPSQYVDYLDYMHARTYRPSAGRFLSVDPILGSPFFPQSWNRYSYVLNNPVNLTDPTGMLAEGGTYSMSITVTATDPERDRLARADRWAEFTVRQALLRAWNPAKDSLVTASYLAPRDFVNKDATLDGLAAWADGVIPFGDPFEDTYDIDELGLRYVKIGGQATQTVAILAAGSPTVLRGVQPGGWMNANRYVRIGFGKGPGARKVFRIAGKVVEKIKSSGHIDIWKGPRVGQ